MSSTMRKDCVYLHKVEISNFRPFGNKFELELPGPGVTLLVGSNGLGKTSWFDAIECGLTGKVRRWACMPAGEMPPADRLRNGSPVDEWRIQLTFGQEGTVFQRTAKRDQLIPDGTSLSAVATYLAHDAPAWGLNEQNLWAFLFATHILPQSSRARTLSLDPEERWKDWIQHAAGLERIDRFVRNLGQGTIGELSKIVSERQARSRETAGRFEAWQSLLRQRDEEQHAVAGLTGAASPSTVSTRLASLLRGRKIPPLAENTLAGAAQMFERIAEYRQETARQYSESVSRRVALDKLREVVDRWHLLLGQKTSLSAELDARRAEVVRITEAVERAKEAELIARQTVAAASQRLGITNELRDLWRRLAASRQDRVHITQAAEQASAQFKEAERTAFEKHAALEKQTSIRARRDKWEADLANVKAEEVRTKNHVRQLTRAAELATELSALESQAQQFQKNVAAARLQLSKADEKHQDCSERLSAAERTRDHIRASTESIRAAVATIASLLNEDSVHCPVCGTPHMHGELVEISRRLAHESSPNVAEAEERITALRSELEGVLAEQRVAAKGVSEALGNLDRLKAQTDRTTAELKAQMNQPEFVGKELADLLRQFAQRAVELATHIRELESSEIGAAGTHAALSAGVEHLEKETAQANALVEAERTKIEHCQRTKDEIDKRIQSLLDALKQRDDAFEDTPNWGSSLHDRTTTAESEVEGHRMKQKAAEKQVAEAEQKRRASTSQLEIASIQIKNIDRERLSLLEQWQSYQLPAEPEGATLANMIAHTDAATAALHQEESELGQLASALDAWRKAESLQTLRNDISKACGGSDSEAEQQYSAQLSLQLTDVEKSQYLSEQIRACADELAKLVSQRSEDLKQTFVNSTKPAFHRLVPLLVEDEMYRRLALSAETKRRKTSVRMPVLSADGSDSQDAEHLMSEGQTAGLSCVLLLSLATTFRWSRWPALLLDDPAQHNDLVHTTNLIEVIRNLVMLHGYQVVLSTHDSTLADFFCRKLRNGGVKTTLCRFLDIGAEGVEARVTF